LACGWQGGYSSRVSEGYTPYNDRGTRETSFNHIGLEQLVIFEWSTDGVWQDIFMINYYHLWQASPFLSRVEDGYASFGSVGKMVSEAMVGHIESGVYLF
jgi:hypothetical protein